MKWGNEEEEETLAAYMGGGVSPHLGQNARAD